MFSRFLNAKTTTGRYSVLSATPIPHVQNGFNPKLNRTSKLTLERELLLCIQKFKMPVKQEKLNSEKKQLSPR